MALVFLAGSARSPAALAGPIGRDRERIDGRHQRPPPRAVDDSAGAARVVDGAIVPVAAHSMLPSVPLLVQRSHVMPRFVILAVAALALALVRRPLRRAVGASTGWRPRVHTRFCGAPLRGPPTGPIPALGI